MAKVNLSGEQARAANIPQAAHHPHGHFAFAFPLKGMNKLTASDEDELERAARTSAELALLINGGFVYMDENEEVVQINAIVNASAPDGLRFNGPFALPAAKRTELIRGRDGLYRFQPPTLGFLKSKGVTCFTWIEPGGLGRAQSTWTSSILAPYGGGSQTFAEGKDLAPYGAFVYLFQDAAFDCYFAVDGKEAGTGCVSEPIDESDADEEFAVDIDD